MKKLSALRDLSNDELRTEELNLRKELFNLRFQKVTGEIENPMMIRRVRKNIARVLTVLGEKERDKDKA
jgi:large subunit ribosomal protein L29